MAIVYGKVKHPVHKKNIVPKPSHTSSGYGYTYIPGGRKIKGGVTHQTGGERDTPAGIARLFGPTGERYAEALTDYVTGKDGELWMLNDPTGTRAGWASGGGVGQAGGLEGDGTAFYSVYGPYGINTYLYSNELCKGFGNQFPVTPAQVKTDGALMAYWHDQAKCPWDTFPLNPNDHNLVLSFLHFEFGTTSCGKDMLDDIVLIQNECKRIMKAAQIGGDDPPPVVVPPQPDPPLPGGITLKQAEDRFGKLKVHMPDGKIVERGFNAKGPISLAWAQRAATDKVWPAAADSYFVKDEDQQINVITFAGSWVLLKASERAAFAWV